MDTPKTDPSKISILLVDDTASLARTYETFLTARGYDVRCAYTGRDAVEDLRRFGADLILLDLDLPDFSGSPPHYCDHWKRYSLSA